jgi:hypothetical protein
LAVLSGFFLPRALAATGLYAAANPVPDQSAKARDKALRQDLASVFVKVSGSASAGMPLPSLANAQALVLQYRYQKLPAGEGGGLALWAKFDANKVNTALGAAGEPIWGKHRPRVIAWVLAPAGLVGNDSTKPVARALTKSAKNRGLPLVLPLLDIADRKRVSDSTVRAFDVPTLEKAAQRYGAQATLAGTIASSTGKRGAVSSHWQLAFDDATNSFSIRAPSAGSSAAAAVAKAAGLLAHQFARVQGSTQAGPIALAVAGVGNLKDEVAVRRFIAGVQGVKNLRLARVNGQTLHFVLTWAGSPDDFSRRLALSGFLVRDKAIAANPPPAAAPPAGSAPRAALSFRYTP